MDFVKHMLDKIIVAPLSLDVKCPVDDLGCIPLYLAEEEAMTMALNTAKMCQLIAKKFRRQADFARACGVSRQYISDVLKGKQIPTLERMVQFADFLGVTVDELLTRKHEPPEDQ